MSLGADTASDSGEAEGGETRLRAGKQGEGELEQGDKGQRIEKCLLVL